MIFAETITITTIVENSTSVSGVLAEWGISVFIEAGTVLRFPYKD